MLPSVHRAGLVMLAGLTLASQGLCALLVVRVWDALRRIRQLQPAW
jgi:hypothetical protein